jgi:hypothetical protein
MLKAVLYNKHFIPDYCTFIDVYPVVLYPYKNNFCYKPDFH